MGIVRHEPGPQRTPYLHVFRQIFSSRSGAGMNVDAVESHLFQLLDLQPLSGRILRERCISVSFGFSEERYDNLENSIANAFVECYTEVK